MPVLIPARTTQVWISASVLSYASARASHAREGAGLGCLQRVKIGGLAAGKQTARQGVWMAHPAQGMAAAH